MTTCLAEKKQPHIRQRRTAHLLLPHVPRKHTHWFSVLALLTDALNPRSPRYLQLRWRPWLRRGITLVQAHQRQQRAKAMSQRSSKRLDTLLDTYNAKLTDVFEHTQQNA